LDAFTLAQLSEIGPGFRVSGFRVQVLATLSRSHQRSGVQPHTSVGVQASFRFWVVAIRLG
jgi:hypothetical protein